MLAALKRPAAVNVTPIPRASRRANFRDALRSVIGPNGERAIRTIAEIAEGRVWTPILEDGSGRVADPVVPTTRDRLEAARYLVDALAGKPVDQTQIPEAERAAADNAELIALSDEELFAKARKVIEGVVIRSQELPAT
jgi:hypothetical protein